MAIEPSTDDDVENVETVLLSLPTNVIANGGPALKQSTGELFKGKAVLEHSIDDVSNAEAVLKPSKDEVVNGKAASEPSTDVVSNGEAIVKPSTDDIMNGEAVVNSSTGEVSNGKAALGSKDEVLDGEAVLEILRNMPCMTKDCRARNRRLGLPYTPGRRSSTSSDLPANFRIVDNLWPPSLTSAIKNYFDAHGTTAEALGITVDPADSMIEYMGRSSGLDHPTCSRLVPVFTHLCHVLCEARSVAFARSWHFLDDLVSPVNDSTFSECMPSRPDGSTEDASLRPISCWRPVSRPRDEAMAIKVFRLAEGLCGGAVRVICSFYARGYFPDAIIDSLDAQLAGRGKLGLEIKGSDSRTRTTDSHGAASLVSMIWGSMSGFCSPWAVLSDTRHWWIFKANYERGGSIDVQRVVCLPGGDVNPLTILLGLGLYDHDSLRRPLHFPDCSSVNIQFHPSYAHSDLRHNANDISTSLCIRGPLDPSDRRKIDQSTTSQKWASSPLSVEIRSRFPASHTWDTFRGVLTPEGSSPIDVILKIATPSHVSYCETHAPNDPEYLDRLDADIHALWHLDRVLPGVGPKWYGLYGGQHETQDVWVVIIEDVGDSIGIGEYKVSPERIPDIHAIYSRLHEAGIKHGSAALKHICWRGDRIGVDRVRLIDFERMQFKKDVVSESKWYDKIYRESRAIDRFAPGYRASDKKRKLEGSLEAPI